MHILSVSELYHVKLQLSVKVSANNSFICICAPTPCFDIGRYPATNSLSECDVGPLIHEDHRLPDMVRPLKEPPSTRDLHERAGHQRKYARQRPKAHPS